MDEREARKVQREASEALLDLGVSLPLKEWRLPFMKHPRAVARYDAPPAPCRADMHRTDIPLDGSFPGGDFLLYRS